MAGPREIAPYCPTPADMVARLLDFAAVEPGEVVVELGSGDGRLLIEAARRGAGGDGYELEDALVRRARKNARQAKVEDRVRFHRADLSTADLSEADVVLFYLLPETVTGLLPRLLAELKPGARVVSHDYRIVPWTEHDSTEFDLDAKVPITGDKGTYLHLYRVPPAGSDEAQVLLPAVLGHAPGAAVLAWCAAADLDPSRQAEREALIVPELDWVWTIIAAGYHEVVPLLHCFLTTLGDWAVPGTLRTIVEGAFRDNGERSIGILSWFAGIHAVLEPAGITAVLAGGPALGAVALGSVGLRQSAGLDVLVAPAVLDEACALVQEAGLHRSRGPLGELRIGPLEAWEQTEEVDVHLGTVTALRPEPLLLRRCIDAHERSWSTLGAVADVGGLLRRRPDIDWELLVARATAHAAADALALGVALARTLLGAPVPDGALAGLAQAGAAADLVDRLWPRPTGRGEASR